MILGVILKVNPVVEGNVTSTMNLFELCSLPAWLANRAQITQLERHLTGKRIITTDRLKLMHQSTIIVKICQLQCEVLFNI